MTFRSRRRIAASRAQPVPVGRGAPRGARAGMAGAAPLVLQRGTSCSANSGLLARSRPPAHVRHKRSARQTFRDELDLARVERLEEHGVDVSSRYSRRARFEQLRSGQAEERAVRVPRLRGTRSGRGTSPLPSARLPGRRRAAADPLLPRRSVGSPGRARPVESAPGSARWRLRSEPRCARRRPRRSGAPRANRLARLPPRARPRGAART